MHPDKVSYNSLCQKGLSFPFYLVADITILCLSNFGRYFTHQHIKVLCCYTFSFLPIVFCHTPYAQNKISEKANCRMFVIRLSLFLLQSEQLTKDCFRGQFIVAFNHKRRNTFTIQREKLSQLNLCSSQCFTCFIRFRPF